MRVKAKTYGSHYGNGTAAMHDGGPMNWGTNAGEGTRKGSLRNRSFLKGSSAMGMASVKKLFHMQGGGMGAEREKVAG